MQRINLCMDKYLACWSLATDASTARLSWVMQHYSAFTTDNLDPYWSVATLLTDAGTERLSLDVQRTSLMCQSRTLLAPPYRFKHGTSMLGSVGRQSS